MIQDKDRLITIIEGPPPTFEIISDGWPQSISDSAQPANLAVTRLRTHNGQSLVERCYRAWNVREAMELEYRQSDGLINQVPIVAARNVRTPEGDLLLLWLRLNQNMELELDYEDDDDEADANTGDDLS
jgi:hypothetical protein